MCNGPQMMTRKAEEDPKFRRLMYAMILALLVGYIGLKSWHVMIAMDAYQGQVLSEDTKGAAK